MKLDEFLPVGSVVLLKKARKKIVIIGVMQVKYFPDGKTNEYDYVGVPYPEGYMGKETGLMFNHDQIQEVVFTGYSNEERDVFVTAIQKIMDTVAEAHAD